MNLLKDTRGASLPLVTGLILLIFTAAVATNELVIRSLQSVGRIEAANRSFLAAEGGIEDALYELSPHFPGYNTAALGAAGSRGIDFDEDGALDSGLPRWENNWDIRSHAIGNCPAGVEVCGEIFKAQKIEIPYFNDITTTTGVGLNGINDPAINAVTIDTENVTGFTLTVKVPEETFNTFNDAFLGNPPLVIDNDNDALISPSGVNEDGSGGSYDITVCPSVGIVGKDDDCDGKDDEDSPDDAVILWKMSNGAGKTLFPLQGCLTDSVPLDEKSEICEKDFVDDGTTISHNLLNENSYGIREDGQKMQISAFIAEVFADSGATIPPNLEPQLKLELSVVAPLEQWNVNTLKKVPIPYLEYEMDITSTNTTPFSYFSIRSDGYYRDFKQSITTTVTPKTIVPLFDFTVIQQ